MLPEPLHQLLSGSVTVKIDCSHRLQRLAKKARPVLGGQSKAGKLKTW